MTAPADVAALVDELGDAELGDPRRSARLAKLARKIADKPEASFPKLAGSEGELEAIYRFLSNEHVSWRAILEPHARATAERCRSEPSVVVTHDTTEFVYRGVEGARDGLGYLTHGRRGFEVHVALALGGAEHRGALGVLGMIPMARTTRPRKKTASEATRESQRKPQHLKESYRWWQLAHQAEERLHGIGPVHVMDREADDYWLLSEMLRHDMRFVIRGNRDRKLAEGEGVVSEALNGVEGRVLREVSFPDRKARKTDRPRPARSARTVNLSVRGCAVTFAKPHPAQTATKTITINAVQVYEPDPPVGEDPINWVLYTSEPIDTFERLVAVVDFYRARWVVEEFFKALKTGCAFEARQLMSLSALLNALAIFAPVAARLLLFRTAARETPRRSAREFLSADELRLLILLSKRVKLTESATIEEALLAIAGLGGHLKRNGPPGWQTICAGYESFRAAYAGWLARESSDQS